jgi:hypothetical protein
VPITGSGAPSLSCGAANYGTPYYDVSSPTAPVHYVCDSSGWAEVSGGGGGTGNFTVQGTATNESMVPVYNGVNNTTGSWKQLTQDDILAGFSITSFTCSTCGNYEIGYTVASPTNFTASYSSTPASASISDGTNTDTLTTPFTSGSLAHSYTTNTTFTLTAIGSTTKTATKTIGFGYRTFYGLGTGGATGATASGNNAVLTGATGTLGTWGLPQNTGTVTVSPSSQYIYFLLTTTGHTFKINGFTTVFSCSSVTFDNQYGTSDGMYLCVSPTYYTGSNYTAEVD